MQGRNYEYIYECVRRYLTPLLQKVASNHLLQFIKDVFILEILFTIISSIFGLVKLQLGYWLTEADFSLNGFLGSLSHVLGNVGAVDNK